MIPNALQIKVFATGLDDARMPEVIPVFHRWITERALGELLVDVADYRHVYQGPGIALIGHESNYALDEHEGRRGLLCHRKRGFPSGTYDSLLDTMGRVLRACVLLERELSMEGRLFDAGALRVTLARRSVGGVEPSAFVEHAAKRLAEVYASEPEVELVRNGGLPGAHLRWGSSHGVASVLARMS